MREGKKTPILKRLFIDCKGSVTFRGKGVKCKSFKQWCHAKRQGYIDTEYKNCAGDCMDRFQLCSRK